MVTHLSKSTATTISTSTNPTDPTIHEHQHHFLRPAAKHDCPASRHSRRPRCVHRHRDELAAIAFGFDVFVDRVWIDAGAMLHHPHRPDYRAMETHAGRRIFSRQHPLYLNRAWFFMGDIKGGIVRLFVSGCLYRPARAAVRAHHLSAGSSYATALIRSQPWTLSLYSKLSTRASQLASMMLSETPTVPQLLWPSVETMSTRVRAAVPFWLAMMRTL